MGHDEGQYQDLMMSGWWWWWWWWWWWRWQILLSPDCKKPDRVLLFEGTIRLERERKKKVALVALCGNQKVG